MLHVETAFEPHHVPSKSPNVKQDEMQEVYMSSDEETMTSATLSTVAPGESRRDSATDTDMDSGSGDEVFRQFHAGIQSATDNISTCKSTYFFDGGKRFISLPTLGNSNIKAATLVSRMFEQWLENKICHTSEEDRVPILEDSVELSCEDIMNTFKQKGSMRAFHGLSHVWLRIRAGHAYFYHQLEDGQPLLSQDMEDFFQDFPLFVEVSINVKTLDNKRSEHHHQQHCKVLVSMENMGINPGKPYRFLEDIHLC
ncbi:hypothetical protein INT43_000002 [Umbelopsis isabellina]|uniref:Uncharacterized protein n=1 Tax=Mortierella isabellina TaxID=91625 RepID=A0A8H7U838_MORIS|nr:hypothetical protein INT43_000002 [Umbelopsis isabellina]